MSLINDALKKAQKLQTQQPMASAPSRAQVGTKPAPMRAVPRRDQPVGYQRMLIGLVALAVLLVGVAVGTILILRKGETPVVAAAPHPAAPAAAASVSSAGSQAAGATTAPAPTPAPHTASTPAPVIQPPAAATASIPPPTPAVSEPAPTVSVTPPPANPAPAAAATVSTPPPTPAVSELTPTVSVTLPLSPAAVDAAQPAQMSNPTPAVSVPVIARQPAVPKQDFRILSFIDKLKILGIRAAGSDSKVLMSGRVYRLNDILDYELGVRLTGVGATALTFTDESGVVYTKSL